ncbi:amino acid ABC transporter permease [Acrocarpospora catenulata]|uniref:amino acid ABC transporter permease n=1 Tax=Acrocarpospora catenulata TaxID=2836182 RepID=UPI001BD9B829|nr:amino acid ABC transporter permease [Acrocarpospora catenulata]
MTMRRQTMDTSPRTGPEDRQDVLDPLATPRPLRHPGHWITGAVAVALGALAVWQVAGNDQLQWGVFWQYLFSEPILAGLVVTLKLTLLAQAIAIAVGAGLALLGESRNPVLRLIVRGYVGFFRGLPLLVLLLICFNAALFVPQIGVGAWNWKVNDLISGFTAAIIGLALHESAFMVEIIRSGFISVSAGQMEAAKSIGMKRGMAMRSIVIPQAIRVIIPPTGNQFISLLKASALVAVIGGGDLLTRAQQIYGANFAVIPLLMVASFWYLVLVSLASLGQHFLERHFALAGARKRTRPEQAKPVEGDGR